MKNAILVGLLLTACGAPTGSELGGGAGGGGGGGGGPGTGGGTAVSFEREALSGTRLKQRYLQGDDGSRSPLGFFDTARNESCTFALAEDGEQRCLPLETLAYPLPNFFFDAACTEPAGFTRSNCTATKYAALYPAQCPAVVVLFDATPQPPPVTTLYRKNVTCDPVNQNPEATSFVRIGARVPASSFARAAVMVEP